YMIREQMIVPAVINFLLNAGIGWLIFRAHPRVPVWGESSFAQDALVTLFLLPFLICLIVTPLVRHELRKGKIAPLSWHRRDHPLLKLLPENLLGRAVVLGLLGVVAGAPFVLGGLWLAGVQTLSLACAVLLKGFYAAVLAALVSPPIAVWVLADTSPIPLETSA
ncbi:MAG: hypothetical protein ACRD3I_08830, partial [Terriglobales bacterium]